MRDAIGGVMTIQIIVIFLLLVNGYLAFSVNYTKAFRVKNRIISLIEQHEGICGAQNVEKNNIDEYLNSMYYNVSDSYFRGAKEDGYTCVTGKGYCYKAHITDIYGNPVIEGMGSGTTNNQYRGAYYSIITYVNIDIPIINKVLPLLDILRVEGETKTIYSSGNNSELGGC